MSDDGITSWSRRTFIKATGAAGAVGALGGVTAATPGRPPGPKEDEVLVGVAASADDLERPVRTAVPGNARVVHKNETLRYVAVRFPSQAPDHARENFIEAVTRKDEVKYAEPNATFEALYTPNDPRYGDQYAPQQVNCEGAWDSTLGDPGVTVSVVDQGVQYDHANLEENMDGSVSNYGRDFADGDGDPYPVNADENHGTHVGGIAAGGTDNGTGHAGISNVSMLSARALDESGSGSLSDIADAITWSADQGAEVINLSLGGGGYTDTMKNAVSYAYDNGSLPVAAAGNDYGSAVSYPAAYSECLAVSALDQDESLANYSNYGDEIELCAPGTDVLSTVPFGNYERLSGTSMATPVVSGVAGLALSAWDLSAADLRSHLKSTAVDVGLPENQQGSGRVDADNAVNTEPGGGGGGDSTTSSVTDSLSSYADSDCWTYPWEFSDPSQVVVELDGPSDADFDLYVNDGRAECPTTSDYDYRSWTTDSQESITVDNPDTSTDLHVLVDSYSGSGEYTLTITEKS
ncbi:S8 family serine peptidase [Halostella sp. JP-L12]|uniref:S8 family serine peptidase n=1 Tax=Halostella TaxID=1843185 RepID=UPI000EF818C5|nr:MULTISPECIES: S8 family serine peptidase [Halostella]NHN48381.1 S8 family serine peptidase [Halostella sp. JP-L12]